MQTDASAVGVSTDELSTRSDAKTANDENAKSNFRMSDLSSIISNRAGIVQSPHVIIRAGND